MGAVQLDFFSDLATEPDWIALLRRAVDHLTHYDPLNAILRDMVRHDADIDDVARLMKGDKANTMFGGGNLIVHTFGDGVTVMQSYRSGERKYTWKRAAQEFAAMYWEEREREEAELEAEYDG